MFESKHKATVITKSKSGDMVNILFSFRNTYKVIVSYAEVVEGNTLWVCEPETPECFYYIESHILGGKNPLKKNLSVREIEGYLDLIKSFPPRWGPA